MREYVPLGLNRAPNEPLGREVAVDKNPGVAEGDEVLGDESIEHDFEAAAAFEHTQRQVVA